MLCFVRSPSSQCDTYQKLEIDIAVLFYLLMDAFWLQPRGVGTVCTQWFRLPCNSNQFQLILGVDSFWVLWCWFGKMSWLENSGSRKMFVAVICHCAMHLINCQLVSRTSSINSMLLVGGFNPFEKYESKWESSPIFGVNIKNVRNLHPG